MLRLRFRFSCRLAFPQTRRRIRICRCSYGFDSSGRTHLPGTSRDSSLCLYSRQLFLVRTARPEKLVGPLSNEPVGGHRWVVGTPIPATLDGHSSDVHPFLLSHRSCVSSSSALGMENGSFWQLHGLGHRANTCQGRLG